MQFIMVNLRIRESSRTKIERELPTKTIVMLEENSSFEDIINALKEKDIIPESMVGDLTIKKTKGGYLVKQSFTAGYPIPFFKLIKKQDVNVLLERNKIEI